MRTSTYISPRLENKLKHLLYSPVGVMVAPAGFGKTKATLVALADVPPKQKHWFTAEKSYTTYENELFDWFVNELINFDLRTALQLRSQGHFNRANRYEICRMVKDMHVDNDQYIVIDNLHYISDDFADALISSLAENSCEKIHLIIISQYLSPKRRDLLNVAECAFVYSSDLQLSKEDVFEYAKKMSINLQEEQLTALWQQTEGWIVVVALYLKKIKEYGYAPINADINSLLYEICWKNLSKDEQRLLLYFYVWQTLSEGCLSYILSNDKFLPSEERAYELINRLPLINFDPLLNSWAMHNLLLEYITLRFKDSLQEIQRNIACCAGNHEKENGNNNNAIFLFFYAKNYDQLLSCNFTNMLMENLNGVDFYDIAEDVCKNCPDDILKKHPLSGLYFCYALYAAAKFYEYKEFLQKMQKIILSLQNSHLLGEWTLVSAFNAFPNIENMTVIYKEAATLLTHASDLFTYKEPFLFGCTSMWYLFYTEAGQMEAFADKIDQMMVLYNSLTEGHGAGAEMIYRGEVYCVQGRFEEAEILAYTAARMAESKKNVTITYAAALLLGIISIYRDDMVELEKAIKYLENRATGYSFMQNTALNQYMTETVRGYLLALLMETQDSSSWTREWSFSETALTFTNFMVKTTQITDIILHKEYKRAIANVEATLTLDSRLISLPTRNFMHVGLALCYLAIGNIIKAAQNLEISLSLTEKDKNYTFLACFRKYLAPLMLLPNVRNGHGNAIKEIKELALKYTIVQKKAIFDFSLKENSLIDELTERELKVAKLAAGGMHNKEIAKTLFISEYTVKNHLSVIYQKLNIDRRGKLIEMLKP